MKNTKITKNWKTPQILKATNGNLVNSSHKDLMNLSFSDICIDSRIINKESFFVAIAGENHDGHKFISDVIKKGIKGILLEEEKLHNLQIQDNILCVSVKDTTNALGDLASFWRRERNVYVAAITGSNGKTSTKEMLAQVLSQKYNTLKNVGNLNNHIGLPMTLLKLNENHEWAVVEMGMNHPGEIDYLTKISEPDIGIITNVGPAHLEGVMTIDGVVNAKGELIEGLKSDAIAILNADDPAFPKLKNKASCDVLSFGINNNANISARSITQKKNCCSFDLILPHEEVQVNLPTPGAFMVSNALAAACAAFHLKLSANEIKKGLETFNPVAGRLNIVTNKEQVNIIDDTYNANPASMDAAFQTLCELKGKNTGFLIVGDMFELGENSNELHEQTGENAAKKGIDKIYATGSFADAFIKGALSAGINKKNVRTDTKANIISELKTKLKPGDWVLVKGSRAMGMETIVSALLNS